MFRRRFLPAICTRYRTLARRRRGGCSIRQKHATRTQMVIGKGGWGESANINFYYKGYEAGGYGLKSPASISGSARFSLLRSIQTDSEVHRGPNNVSAVGSFFWIKLQGLVQTAHLHLVRRSLKVELYLQSPMCLHGCRVWYRLPTSI
jgi:hypothetical protein